MDIYSFDEIAPEIVKELVAAILINHPTPEVARSSIENVFVAGYLKGRADGITESREFVEHVDE